LNEKFLKIFFDNDINFSSNHCSVANEFTSDVNEMDNFIAIDIGFDKKFEVLINNGNGHIKLDFSPLIGNFSWKHLSWKVYSMSKNT
jgi:hypothetical protein